MENTAPASPCGRADRGFEHGLPLHLCWYLHLIRSLCTLRLGEDAQNFWSSNKVELPFLPRAMTGAQPLQARAGQQTTARQRNDRSCHRYCKVRCTASIAAPGWPLLPIKVDGSTETETSQQRRPVCKSLHSAQLCSLGGGHYVLPVLQPLADGLPFAMALSLFRQEPGPAAQRPQREPGMSQLQYVLDGTGRVQERNGAVQPLQAGDSVLMQLGQAWCCAAEDAPGNRDCWDMAALTLLLPEQLAEQDQGTSTHEAAARAAARWLAAPVSHSLEAATIDQILQGASQRAVQAVSRWGDSHSPSGHRIDAAGTAPRRHLGPLPSNRPSAQAAAGSAAAVQPAAMAPDRSASGAAEQPRRQWHWPAEALQAQVRQLQRQWAWLRQQAGQLLWRDSCIVKRKLADLQAFRLPNQTNRLALVFDPIDSRTPFTFGVEVFEPGHRTTPHTHKTAHELFFVLAGSGEAFCDGERFPLSAGDAVVFPPTTVHGIDNGAAGRMYCLELMLPNEMFAEFVRQGTDAGSLDARDLCVMLAQGCK